ncbi:MAG: class I SAM-dependent methyltransferase [Limisphaerales bacterium]
MHYWAGRIIKPYCRTFGYGSLCEIGASTGATTDAYLEAQDLRLALVDPCLDAELFTKYKHNKRVTIHRGLSLEILPELSECFDCILIDGDHNWYTVFNELNTIDQKGLLKEGGTIFLHDVSWPYGRRDMYYQPDTIPAAFRHAYAKQGIIAGRSRLSPTGGLNPRLCNAVEEGGERNGVLTAIEDFQREHKNKYFLFRFKEEHGLAVLFRKGGPGSARLVIKWLLVCKWRNIFRPAAIYRAAGLAANQRFPRLCAVVRRIKHRWFG